MIWVRWVVLPLVVGAFFALAAWHVDGEPGGTLLSLLSGVAFSNACFNAAEELARRRGWRTW